MKHRVYFLLFITIAFSCDGNKQIDTKEESRIQAINLYELAKEKSNKGEYKLASKNLEKATALDSGYYKAFSLLGEIQFLRTHEYAKSLTNLDKAISFHSDSIIGDQAEDYIFRGGVKKEMNQFKGAIEDFDASLQIVEIAYTYHKIGICYLALADTTQACYYLNLAITKDYVAEKDYVENLCGVEY